MNIKNLYRLFAPIIISFAVLAVIDLGLESVYAGKADMVLTIKEGAKEVYQVGDEFTIQVAINGEERIGAYSVQLAYDSDRLTYQSGADYADNGLLGLNGTGYGNNLNYELKFKAKDNGVSWIKIQGAGVSNEGSNGAEQTFSKELPIITMTIGSVDSIIRQENLTQYGVDTDVKLVAKAGLSGSTQYYIVDMDSYEPEDVEFAYSRKKKNVDGEDMTFIVTKDGKNSFVCLMNEQQDVFLYAYNSDNHQLYPCKEVLMDGKSYCMMSADICKEWPSELNEGMVKKSKIVYAVDDNGVGKLYRYTGDGHIKEMDISEVAKENKSLSKLEMGIIIIIVLVIVCTLIVIIARVTGNIAIKRRREKEREADLMYEEGEETLIFQEDE